MNDEKKQMLQELARRRGYRPEQVKEAELQNNLKKFRRYKKRFFSAASRQVRRGWNTRIYRKAMDATYADPGEYFALIKENFLGEAE